MKNQRKISVIVLAKFQSALGALIGLLCGILYGVGGLIIDTLVSLGWVSSQATPGLSYGTLLALGAVVGMPVIFAAVGFLIGISGGILFNLFSKWTNGLEIDFEKKG
jgi:hypothetical protein